MDGAPCAPLPLFVFAVVYHRHPQYSTNGSNSPGINIRLPSPRGHHDRLLLWGTLREEELEDGEIMASGFHRGLLLGVPRTDHHHPTIQGGRKETIRSTGCWCWRRMRMIPGNGQIHYAHIKLTRMIRDNFYLSSPLRSLLLGSTFIRVE